MSMSDSAIYLVGLPPLRSSSEFNLCGAPEMRVAILWIELTGYLNSCLRELASRPGVEIFVAHTPPGSNAPFANEQFGWLSQQFVWRSSSDLDSLDARLSEFRPDVIVFAGWAIPAYRRVAKQWKSRATRIMTMDNCWVGTPKQWAGWLMAPFVVQTLADAIWIPGERQIAFASKLRFKHSEILRGLYSCDYSAFSAVYEGRVRLQRPLKRAFIFVGRIIEKKGVPTLAAAYRLYRSRVGEPWPLICYGRGPLSEMLEAEPGVIVEGFVQPDSLPGKLAEAACLVIPSSFEPWALVVHEAAAAGLLILASDAVGAVPHLVQDNYNGFVFGVNDVEGLSRLMERVGSMSDAKLSRMGTASSFLARQFTPTRWTDTVLEYAEYARHIPDSR
jgi:glycosyltransferase involved in cell wall biosynthesis